jgi:hypothetical protein
MDSSFDRSFIKSYPPQRREVKLLSHLKCCRDEVTEVGNEESEARTLLGLPKME